MNTKAQTGTVQGMMIALVVITLVAVLGSTYISSIATNYGVTNNVDSYGVFNQTQEISNLTNTLSDSFVPDTAQQTTNTNSLNLMIDSVWGMVKLFFNIPKLYTNLILGGLNAMGVPSSASYIIFWALNLIIVIIIMFAAYEAVMKVRS
jgi:hypothetical protein